ncbi:MAG: hypothetical protein MMC33_006859 [Icmadophila ericetorum]|nr:hypothetical protein [Icmadophila ericetorum]
MAEPDRSNFSSPSSSHRLPTISAIDALNNVTTTRHSAISTGLPALDRVLQGRKAHVGSQGEGTGGLSRGAITEVYGPPGVGKTCFGYFTALSLPTAGVPSIMHAAVSTLRAGNSVIWIDTAHTIVGQRLASLLSSTQEPPSENSSSSPAPPLSLETMLSKFHHFQTPTLPHLLALLTHPSPSFPPPKITVIIIDAMSTLFLTAFPRLPDTYDTNHNQTPAKKSLDSQWAAGRKFSVMGDLISKLGRMAAVQNIAILLISQVANKIQHGQAGVLYPTIQLKNWEQGVNTRIVLYRDWLPPEDGKRVMDVRFAAVVKLGGTPVDPVQWRHVIPFVIPRTAPYQFQEIPLPSSILGPALQQHASNSVRPPSQTLPFLPPPPSQPKRKREEIADSDDEEDGGVVMGSDEEFGWFGGEDAGDELLLLEEDGLEGDPSLVPGEDVGDVEEAEDRSGD